METVYVTIRFTTPILGTTPEDHNTWESFIRPLSSAIYRASEEARVRQDYMAPAAMRRRARADAEAQRAAKRAADRAGRDADPVDVTDPDEAEGPVTVFFHDQKGPFLWDYQIMGHLKELGDIHRDRVGIAALKRKIESFVVVLPRRIYFEDWQVGLITRPLRAETMRGPRVTIASSHAMFDGATLKFKLLILDNGDDDETATKKVAKGKKVKAGITADLVHDLMRWGRYRGMGQWRTGNWGRYEIVSWLTADGDATAEDPAVPEEVTAR